MALRRALVALVVAAALPSPSRAGRSFELGPVTIENVAEEYGLYRVSTTFGASTLDVNRDGWPDLLVSNHGQMPSIFLNREGESFEEVEGMLPLRAADRHTPLVADFDNDGDQDVYFLRGAHDGTGEGANELLVNQGRDKPFRLVEAGLLADRKGRGRTGVWFDYDNDGFLDLYVANKLRADAPNRLFKSNGDGTFKDVSAGSGLRVNIKSEGGTLAADFDADGRMDLLIADTDNRPHMMMNQGDGTFRDEAAARGIPMMTRSWSLAAADYNDDGQIDIYISRGFDGASAEGAVMSGHRLNFLHIVKAPGDTIDLLTFAVDTNAVLSFSFSSKKVDLSALYVGAEGISPATIDFTVGPGHLAPDGRPKQYQTDGSRKGTFIWREPGTERWTIATAAGSGRHLSGGFLTTDSFLRRLSTEDMEAWSPTYPNFLLKNTGDGRFVDATSETATGDPSNSRSPVWLDLDNDGDLDLFVVNAGFNGPGKQPDTCYVNENGGFQEYHLEMGSVERFGRGDGAVVADFNKDGLQDLFVVNGSGLLPAAHGPYQLFLNRTANQNRWIAFKLVGGGRGMTNRDAVGAKVELHTPDQPNRAIWRFVLGGSGSYCQSSRVLHFGLGSSESVTAVVYWPPSKKWPRGHTQTFDFGGDQLNQIHVVKEGSSESAD